MSSPKIETNLTANHLLARINRMLALQDETIRVGRVSQLCLWRCGPYATYDSRQGKRVTVATIIGGALSAQDLFEWAKRENLVYEGEFYDSNEGAAS